MNETLEQFAREYLKKGLAQLPDKNQLLFKRMYSHQDTDKPIDKVVDDMTTDKLDWAMTQVQNTLEEQKIKV